MTDETSRARKESGNWTDDTDDEEEPPPVPVPPSAAAVGPGAVVIDDSEPDAVGCWSMCMADKAAELSAWSVHDGAPVTGAFVNKQGLRVAHYTWSTLDPSKARAVVVLVHGIEVNCRFEYLRHRSLYDEGEGLTIEGSLIAKLNGAGCACVGLDLSGHGRSEGRDGLQVHVEDFAEWEDDVLQLVREVADPLARELGELSGRGRRGFFSSFRGGAAGGGDGAEARVPIFVLGLSLGGLLTCRVAQRLGDDARFGGAIAVCPALSVEKIKRQPKNAVLLPLLSVLSRTWPTLALGDKAAPTTDAAKRLEQDKRADTAAAPEHRTGIYGGLLRTRVAAEVLKVTDVAVAQADRWVMPALFVHSRTDTMCDPEGTERMFGLIASSKQSTLAWTQDLGCPEMWHALISERGCELVHEKIVSWIEGRLA